MTADTRALFAGLLLAISLASCADPDDGIVAWVESEPVTVAELHHFMLLEKAAVYNELYHRHGMAYSPSFWLTDMDGETPLEMLKRRALDESITFKTQQILARSIGVPVETNFDQLMKDRLRVNAERAEHHERGGVLYGPVEMDARNYLGKVRDDMIQKSRDLLSEERFMLRQKVLESEYAAFLEHAQADGRVDDTVEFATFRAIRQHEHAESQYGLLVQELRSKASIVINDRVFSRVTMP